MGVPPIVKCGHTRVNGSETKIQGNLKTFIQVIGDIYRWLSRNEQLGGLVPAFRLGVPLRYRASKLWNPLFFSLSGCFYAVTNLH